jgi:uncharacterized protein
MRLLFAFLVSFFLAACSQGHPGNLPVDAITVDTASGPVTFKVEIAADEAARERGLMFRTSLAPDAGMLFDYHRTQSVAFWMKNTPLPLDMIFIRADGRISTIVTDTTPYSETPIPSLEPVQAVLEINGGRSREVGLRPGDVVHARIFGNKK